MEAFLADLLEFLGIEGLVAGFEVAFAEFDAAVAVVERLLTGLEGCCGMGIAVAAARVAGGGNQALASEVRLLRE